MNPFKVLLLLPMMALELILVMVCWSFAFINPRMAAKMVDWCENNLPDFKWYIS